MPLFSCRRGQTRKGGLLELSWSRVLVRARDETKQEFSHALKICGEGREAHFFELGMLFRGSCRHCQATIPEPALRGRVSRVGPLALAHLGTPSLPES